VTRSTAPSAASACETALQRILPARERGDLLAACLRDGAAAADAWSRFVSAVGDAKAYFEADHTGLKGLLPFVEVSLAANRIDAGKAFHTYSRVALVREELRRKIYGEILGSVVAALDAAQIRFVLLKGAAISATAYPQPSARHNHAIDLLVDAGAWTSATRVLSNLQFEPTPAGSGAAMHRDFRHWTGLALGLHLKVFFLPYFEMPVAATRDRVRTLQVDGSPVCVMSPEDNLVHVCGHAIYSRSRGNLRWACDAAYLLQNSPDFNWSTVVDTAAGAGLALPLSVLLRWVSAVLVNVPERALEQLRARGSDPDALASEGIYASLLHTMQSRRQAFNAFGGDIGAQLGFLRFSAVPSLRYMRWKHNIEHGWKLAVRYADRPRRFVFRGGGA
jgi:hypothetical protein